MKGLKQIINIKASINLGLSDLLKSEFSEIFPVERPMITTIQIPDPNWISGFTSGEGNFNINIFKTNKIGYQVQLRFKIIQQKRDIKLMELLIKYLKCGKIEKEPKTSVVNFTIYKITDITNLIIPFFEKNTIHGAKRLD